MQYDPRVDPLYSGEILEADKGRCAAHDRLWAGVEHIQGFQDAALTFWKLRLALARKLCRIFSLSLDLPENYFDNVTTHPGADAVFTHYPGVANTEKAEEVAQGIGSHTDIQCFTLLWQDMTGGLQVLSKEGQWLKAPPRQGRRLPGLQGYFRIDEICEYRNHRCEHRGLPTEALE